MMKYIQTKKCRYLVELWSKYIHIFLIFNSKESIILNTNMLPCIHPITHNTLVDFERYDTIHTIKMYGTVSDERTSN
jgi:hypothetical protein